MWYARVGALVLWASAFVGAPAALQAAEPAAADLSFNGCENRSRSGTGAEAQGAQDPRAVIESTRTQPKEQTDVISGRVFKSISLKQVQGDADSAARDCWSRLDGVWREQSEIRLDRTKDPEGWEGTSTLQLSIANGNFTTPSFIIVEPGPDASLRISTALEATGAVEYVQADRVRLQDALKIRGPVKGYRSARGDTLSVDVTLSGYVRLRLNDRVYLRPKPGVTKAVAENQTPADDAFLVSFTLENMVASRRGYDVVTQDPFFIMQNAKSEVFAQVDRRNYVIEERRIVPMGFTLHKIDAQGTVFRKDLSTSAKDTQRTSAHSFGANLSGSGEVLGYGVKASAGYDHAQSTMRSMRESKTVAQAVAMARVKQYALIVDHPYVTLSESFIDAVEDARRHSDYTSLIRRFGTHYSYATTFGAVGKMTQNFSQTSLERTLTTEQKNSFNSSLSVTNPVGASMAGEAYYSNSQGKSDGSAQMNENERSEFVAAGGNGSWNEMGFSPGQTPYPILLDLRPLHELLNPINFPGQPEVYDVVRNKLARAIRGYIEEHTDELDEQPLVAKFAAPKPLRPPEKRAFVKYIRYDKGDISYYRTSNSRKVGPGNVRICLVNNTGQPKYMRWTRIQNGVNSLRALKNGSRSCATLKTNQRVTWDFKDRKRMVKREAMTLNSFGGSLVEFFWVRDY